MAYQDIKKLGQKPPTAKVARRSSQPKSYGMSTKGALNKAAREARADSQKMEADLAKRGVLDNRREEYKRAEQAKRQRVR